MLKFTCEWRSDLLCDLQRFSSGNVAGRRFVGFKITRALVRTECLIEVQRAALLHIASDGSVRSTYYLRNVASIKLFSDDASAFALFVNGRPRMFASPERDALVRIIAEACTKLGLSSLMSDDRLSTQDYRAIRAAHGNDRSPKLAEFDVLKLTSKYSTPRPRRLVITENSITERDTVTYTVISSRPLNSLFAVVRHWDEPQKVTFEYTDCQSRTYICSYRDELVASALDGAANAGNRSVEVVAVVLKQGLRCFPRTLELEPNTEAIYLKRLQGICKTIAQKQAEGGSVGPYSSELHYASAEFNANVSSRGVAFATKKSNVNTIIPVLINQLRSLLSHEDMPTAVILTFLQTLCRLVSAKDSSKQMITITELGPVLQMAMDSEDDAVCFWGVELLSRMFRNPQRPPAGDREADDLEANVKRVMLSDGALRLQLVELLDSHAAGNRTGGAGALVTLGVVRVLDSVLIRNMDTTAQDQADHLKQLVASRYLALLSLFRSKCSALTECAALLMRLIVLEADLGTARAMQEVCLVIVCLVIVCCDGVCVCVCLLCVCVS